MPIIDTKNSSTIDHRNVKVKVEFLKLLDIDSVNKKFMAEILIESKWNDFNMNIAESNQSQHWVIKSNEYDMNKHWNPRLYLKNLASEPKEFAKYKVYKENSTVTVTETKIVRGNI